MALQSELSSDAIMGRRFFFWTGNIREVLVTLVLAFAILQGLGWSSNWLSIVSMISCIWLKLTFRLGRVLVDESIAVMEGCILKLIVK